MIKISLKKHIRLLGEKVKKDRRYEEGIEIREEYCGYNIYFNGAPSTKPEHREMFSDARRAINEKYIVDASLTHAAYAQKEIKIIKETGKSLPLL